MGSPRLRVVAKVWMFAFVLFFIFFFVVNGIRYTKWVGFVEKSWYYEAQFWSEDQRVIFNDITYRATNRKLQLYNVENWCYKIQFADHTKTQCIQNGKVFYDVFLQATGFNPIDSELVTNCPQIQRQAHWTYSIKWLTFSKPINAAFVARDIQFLQVGEQLFSCTPDFKTCNEIGKVAWEPICSIEKWLIFNEDGKLKLLSIQ